jgi:hypothetical protein
MLSGRDRRWRCPARRFEKIAYTLNVASEKAMANGSRCRRHREAQQPFARARRPGAGKYTRFARRFKGPIGLQGALIERENGGMHHNRKDDVRGNGDSFY